MQKNCSASTTSQDISCLDVVLGRERVDGWPVEFVDLHTLVTDNPARSSEVDQDHVLALTESGAELPPIVVHRATRRVIDGVHRLHAARERGERRIRVRYFDGDDADAFVLGVNANVEHGLPLSLADRKRAARRIIRSHPQWADRVIAAATGLAPGTVAAIRDIPTSDSGKAESRVGRDGKIRPLNGTRGRRAAAELIAKYPEASLREIAAAAGLSPETVRDVRRRVRRGEEPVPSASCNGGARRPDAAAASQRDAPAPNGAVVPVGSPDPTSVAALSSDPAVRFSEGGRKLIRLLSAHRIDHHSRQLLVDHVPSHCTKLVASIARQCAAAWHQFADDVEHRGHAMR